MFLLSFTGILLGIVRLSVEYEPISSYEEIFEDLKKTSKQFWEPPVFKKRPE